MKNYLLLDANIYLDLIAHRSSENPEKTLELLELILNGKEIKLILPEIVINEVLKNIETVVNNVVKKIKNSINQLNKIYWLNLTDKDIKDFENDILETKKTVTPPKNIGQITIKHLIIIIREKTNE